MIQTLDQLMRTVQSTGMQTISVAAAHDAHVLKAVSMANDLGIANALLIGDAKKIHEIAAEQKISLATFSIIDETDNCKACELAVKFVRDGKAQLLMKGLVDTAVILKAVLNKACGLRKSETLSHVAVFEVPGYERLICVTDAAINMYPDVHTKRRIIENSLEITNALEIGNPIVACVCAIEKVNTKMEATLDARDLVEMNKNGAITGCIVAGPLALDNAISKEAAIHKGINDPSAGNANVLLVPDIDAGNILYKALAHMAKAKYAGIFVGAEAPVVTTSRADSEEAKLYSIALALKVQLSKN